MNPWSKGIFRSIGKGKGIIGRETRTRRVGLVTKTRRNGVGGYGNPRKKLPEMEVNSYGYSKIKTLTSDEPGPLFRRVRRLHPDSLTEVRVRTNKIN